MDQRPPRARDEGHDASTTLRRVAVEALAKRARSASAIGDVLRSIGASDEAVRTTLDWLREQRLIDDDALAVQHARRLAARGLGREEIVRRLTRDGIEPGTAERAAAGTCGDELERAVKLAVARAGTAALQRLDPAARGRRLAAWMARRGFDQDAVGTALERLGLGGGEPGDSP